MPRYAAKIDDNQNDLVKYLRSLGANVAITSTNGKGFTDLVIGIAGESCLVEIKDGDKPKSKRKLTQAEAEFHANFTGKYFTVDDEQDCLNLVIQMLQDGYTKAQNQYWKLCLIRDDMGAGE